MTPGESKADEQSRFLPVRTRVTTSGNGDVERRMSVFCRRRERSLSVDECAECGACRGWVFDPSRQDSFVICEPEADLLGQAQQSSDRLDTLLKRPVRDVMTLGSLCVRGDVSVDTLLALFVDKQISGVPVVDEQGRPIGVATKTDVVRAVHERQSSFPLVDNEDLAGGELDFSGTAFELGGVLVRDIMTPLCFFLAEHTPLGYAAALMAYERVHRAPVLDQEGRVTGMLTAFDVLRHLAEAAGHRV